MPITTNSLQFFGLDLGQVWQELRQAWRGMQKSPALAWLTPDFPVRVLRADGTQAFWCGAERVASVPKPPRFEAIEVPDSLLLRKTMLLPAMPEAEVAHAVELEARSGSPFAAMDLVWGYRAATSAKVGQGAPCKVELLLASRSQVAEYVETQRQHLAYAAQPCEVWAFTAQEGSPVVLQGWGEALRVRAGQRRRHMAYGLLAGMFAMLVAMAITPTAQLRLRAIEATHAHEDMQRKTADVVGQREAYLHAVERIDVVRGLLAERAEPMRLLEVLTEALPDGTYLQSLRVQGLKATIQGLTPDAAALMQSLGKVRGVKEVKAPSAAVRNPGATADSFIIELQLDPALLSQFPAPPPAAPAPPAPPAPSETAPPVQQPAPPGSTVAAVPPQAPASAPRKSRFTSGE